MSDDFWTALENYEEPSFHHLDGCPGGMPSVLFGGQQFCWTCQPANYGYQRGQRDMLARCVAAVEGLTYTDNPNAPVVAAYRHGVLAALRALQNTENS